MKIDRTNYESYFIDYMDGNLPPERIDDFLDFLRDNPDLEEELQAVSNLKLESEHIELQDKNSLFLIAQKQEEFRTMQAVSFLEGDMTAAEQMQFLKLAEQEENTLKTLTALQKTKLKPDFSIGCPQKEKLLRKKRPTISLWMPRVAAVLLIGITAYALISQLVPEKPIPIALQQADSANENESDVIAETLPLKSEATAEARIPEIPQSDQPEKQIIINSLGKMAEPAKKLPETEHLIVAREEIPSEIIPIQAQLTGTTTSDGGTPKIKLSTAVSPQPLTVDEYLAHKIINAPKGETFTFDNLTKAGLNLAQNISNDRLDIERNEQGKLRHIKFESRLIAFSIPLNKNR